MTGAEENQCDHVQYNLENNMNKQCNNLKRIKIDYKFMCPYIDFYLSKYILTELETLSY